MKNATRTGLGIVAGIGLAFILVIAVEAFSAVVHPIPADFRGTMDEMCQHVARYPNWVLGFVVILWSATALCGVWIAIRVGNLIAGITVTALLGIAIVFNVTQLPYPLWFKIVMLSCFPLGCFFGIWKANRIAKAAGSDL